MSRLLLMSTATNSTANDNGGKYLWELTPEEEACASAGRKVESDRIAALAHTRGAKYASGRDVAATAKLIRKDLAAACKAPAGPLSGCVCRVTTRRASMMVAIDVEIVSVPERGAPIVNGRWVEAEDSGANLSPRPSILSKRGAAMHDAAEAIVAQYNFNNSDTLTDYHHVGFYGGVTFASEVKQASIVEVRRALALLAI